MMPIALERNIWINAPRERVWQAVSDPDQIVKWFVPNLSWAQMKRDDGGKITVHLGPVGVDFAVLESVVENQHLTIRSLPDRLITTTYHLKDENGGTSVAVKATGFEALKAAAQEDRVQLSGAGWDKTLKNLEAFVSGSELPFPQAYVGPLFGYWRETKTTLASERSIWIKASPERVWKAITDPKQIQAWSSPATEWHLSALEVGGRFYIKDAETNAEQQVELIELIDASRQLSTRTVPESPSNLVKGKTYTLAEENGGTRLTVTLVGYEQEPEATRYGTLEENSFGYGMMLQNTKAYLEGQPLPFPDGF